MKLNSLSYLASILLLLFCFLLQLISALQPVSLSTPTHVEIGLKKPLERRQDKFDSPPNEPNDKANHDSDGKPLPSKKDDMTITEINVTLTTIVYGSAQPTIHNASNTAAARQQQQQQQQQQATYSASDPNGESLKSKLEEDQAALRRMIMILSLVGGLGVIAVVATVVIFTRMRARSRKQREIEEEEEDGNEDSTYELSGGMDQHSETSIAPDSTQNSNAPSHSDNNHIDNSDGDDDNNNNNNHHIEPSAPPALMMATMEGPSSFNNSNAEEQRHVVSMLSQTAAPSAPTAKELDAMIDEETSQQPTTSNYLQTHSHSYGHSRGHTMCDHCSPLMTPEPPPPAYTPSAPPHYALPIEPVMATHHETSPVLSPRRHSLGS